MGQTRSMDYARRTKQGVIVGFALFAVGAIGEIFGHTLLTGFPEWGQTLLFDAMIVGTLTALLSVVIFGITLPLTE